MDIRIMHLVFSSIIYGSKERFLRFSIFSLHGRIGLVMGPEPPIQNDNIWLCSFEEAKPINVLIHIAIVQ